MSRAVIKTRYETVTGKQRIVYGELVVRNKSYHYVLADDISTSTKPSLITNLICQVLSDIDASEVDQVLIVSKEKAIHQVVMDSKLPSQKSKQYSYSSRLLELVTNLRDLGTQVKVVNRKPPARRRKAKEPGLVLVESSSSLTLTEDQERAIESLTDFLLSPDAHLHVLEGAAGTGKSTIVHHLISKIPNLDRVVLTAPTNQAVTVISQLGHTSVSASTIHKVLGLGMDVGGYDVQYEQVLTKKAEGLLDMYDLIVVDECSMIDDQLFRIIRSAGKHTKFLFMGDPYQLPPVNYEISPTFTIDTKTTLDQIVRQDAGPLLDYLTSLRNNIDSPDIPSPPASDQTVKLDSLEELINKAANMFLESQDSLIRYRVLAWRNETVDLVNSRLRPMVYGTDEEYIEGEVLLAKRPSHSTTGKFDISTSSLLRVVENYGEQTYSFKNPYGRWQSVPVTHIRVEEPNTGKQCVIRVVTIAQREQWKNAITNFKKEALSLSGENARKLAMQAYYDTLHGVSAVQPAFASTVHKAQGTTVDVAFVVTGDIALNPRVRERNRCLYTAFSRAREKVYYS